MKQFLNLFLYLIPWTYLLINKQKISFYIFIIYFILYIIYFFKKNTQKESNFIKNLKENKEDILNIFVIILFFNLLFFTLLNLCGDKIYISTINSYIKLYENLNIIIYNIFILIFFPLFNNILLRKNLIKFKNKKIYIFFIIIFIGFIQNNYILSLYYMVFNLIIFYYLNKYENFQNCIFFEIINNLLLSILILYYKDFSFIISLLLLILLNFIIYYLFKNKN